MKKVYIVTEEFGEYKEDSSSRIIGVCSTEALAKKLVKSSENYYNREINISEDKWNDLEQEVCDYQMENEDSEESDITIMHKLHPEISMEDLEEASDKYFIGDDYAFTSITEAEVYESEKDLINYYKNKLKHGS